MSALVRRRRVATNAPPDIATLDPTYFSVEPDIAITLQRGVPPGDGTVSTSYGQHGKGATRSLQYAVSAGFGACGHVGKDRVPMLEQVTGGTNYVSLLDAAYSIPAGADFCYVQRGRMVAGGAANVGGFRSGAAIAPSGGTTFCIWDSNRLGWIRVNGSNVYDRVAGLSTPADGSLSCTSWRFISGAKAEFGVNGRWQSSTTAVTTAAFSVRPFFVQGTSTEHPAGEWVDAFLWTGNIPSRAELDRKLSTRGRADFFAPWRGPRPSRRFISVAGAPGGARPQGPLGHPLHGALGGPI